MSYIALMTCWHHVVRCRNEQYVHRWVVSHLRVPSASSPRSGACRLEGRTSAGEGVPFDVHLETDENSAMSQCKGKRLNGTPCLAGLVRCQNCGDTAA